MRLIALARRRLASQAGFTLVEMMVAIALSAIVFTALIYLLESSGRSSARVTDKAETVQRMRIAMDRVTRSLRTMSCADSNTPPIIDGQANSIAFYSDINSGTTFAPRKVSISFASGAITQQIFVPTNSAAPWTYSATPSQTSVLATGVSLIADTPLFAYFSWSDLAKDVDIPLAKDLSTTTLAPNSIAKIVRIDTAFKASALSGRTSTAGQTSLTNSVYVRNADYSGTAQDGRTWGPRCA